MRRGLADDLEALADALDTLASQLLDTAGITRLSHWLGRRLMSPHDDTPMSPHDDTHTP